MKFHLFIFIALILSTNSRSQIFKKYPNYGVIGSTPDGKEYFLLMNKNDFKVYKNLKLNKMSYSFSGSIYSTKIDTTIIDDRCISYIGIDFSYYVFLTNTGYDIISFIDGKKVVQIFLLKKIHYNKAELKKLTLDIMDEWHNMKLERY